jgi:1-deoxy-D-xylulose-5-phosphate reductoisomerase
VADVVRRLGGRIKIGSLATYSNADMLISQAKEFGSTTVCIGDESKLDYVREALPGVKVVGGKEGFREAAVAEDCDEVIISVAGTPGLQPTLDAIETGKEIALASKEVLVAAGHIVMKAARDKGVRILPIDSEHSAIFQCLQAAGDNKPEKLLLTASGGPFRTWDRERIAKATRAEALKHPNWNMGAKITVDSATLVNKGFEVIEAKWLFNASFDKIDVIIHRESVIHSMVEYKDGSVVAQLGVPSMELPIQVAISYPERFYSGATRLDLTAIKNLTFEKLDEEKFPCFKEIVNAGKNGGAYPAVACGANDTAVAAFLQGRIKYTDIYRGIRGALDAFKGGYDGSYESLKSAHDFAAQYVKTRFGV